jgi:hypothetical protein
MPLNTIYQLIHNQSFGDEKLLNVYMFNHAVGSGNAGDLASDFLGSIYPAVLDLQCVQIKSDNIEVINLGDLGDFTTLATTGDHGTREGEMLPVFNGIGYTFKLNTRAVRNGSKRIAGIPEVEQVDGTITNAGYITAIETLRNAFLNPITGAGDTWQPVVVKRVRTAITGTVPLKYRYRLPTDDSELVTGDVVAVLSNLKITHQVSRGN